MNHLRIMICCILILVSGSFAQAESSPQTTTRTPSKSVQSSGRPLPRFVSLKAQKANVRRGPSLSHRIDWIFVQRHMPLKIIAEYKHWRRVVDHEGQGGWVHYRLLSGKKTVLVAEDLTPLKSSPSADSHDIARLEEDVIAFLDHCKSDWCAIGFDGYDGWVPKDTLWGVE